MKGYYGEPELTKESFTEDSWLRTSDIGYIDEENFIHLTGRLKNLIILSNGENVSPEEIEAEFATEPLIRDIIVFQENDIIMCEIYPDMTYAGIKEKLEEEVKKIISRINTNLPSYKRIMKSSLRLKPFLKTTSNKIIRSAFFEERKLINDQEAMTNIHLPETETQQKIYADGLGHHKFGIDTDFYSVGLDSFGLSVVSYSSLPFTINITSPLPFLN